MDNQIIQKCGINPWGDAKRFHHYLDHINESGIYKGLVDVYAVEVLDNIIKKLMGVIINLLKK